MPGKPGGGDPDDDDDNGDDDEVGELGPDGQRKIVPRKRNNPKDADVQIHI